MEYNFVVVYDSESNSFRLDYQIQEEKFANSPIYDPKTGEWIHLSADYWFKEGTDYNLAADTLYKALENLSVDRRGN